MASMLKNNRTTTFGSEEIVASLPLKFQPIAVGPQIAVVKSRETGKPVIKTEQLYGQSTEADLYMLTVLAVSISATALSDGPALLRYEFGFTQILDMRMCGNEEKERRKQADGYGVNIPTHPNMQLKSKEQQATENFKPDPEAELIGNRYVLTR